MARHAFFTLQTELPGEARHSVMRHVVTIPYHITLVACIAAFSFKLGFISHSLPGEARCIV
jgi:hypothetical protein